MIPLATPRRLAFSCFLVCCVLRPTLGRADGPSTEGWLRECKAASQRLRQAYTRVRATGTLNRSLEPKTGESDRIELAVDDGRQKLSNDILDLHEGKRRPKYQMDYVLGAGSAFEVLRDGAASNAFQVKRFAGTHLAAQEEVRREIDQRFMRCGGKYLFAPFRTDIFDINQILDPEGYRANGKDYRIVSAERVMVAGDDLMRVRFASPASNPKPVTGQVDFLVKRSWAIRRLKLDMSAWLPRKVEELAKKLRFVMIVDYGPDQMGVPVPTSTIISDGVGSVRCDFDEVRLGATTPSGEFTLGHYGLPDLSAPVADPSRSSLVYWLLGAALVGLIGAIVVKRRQG